MNKWKLLFIFLSLLGIVGVVLSVIMLISAIRFYELGRVFLYAVTALISIEMMIISLLKVLSKRDK